MQLSRALQQTLESLQRAGVTQLPKAAGKRWKIPATIAAAETPVEVQPIPAPAAVHSETNVTEEQSAAGNMPLNKPPASTSLPARPLSPMQPQSTPSMPPPATLLAAVEHSAALIPGQGAAALQTLRVESETRFMKAVKKPRAEREQCLVELAGRVAACTRCAELAQARTQTVFGVGNPEAEVMYIGEAPGADEDAQGEPFVGRAGQLLDRITGACGWKREDLYICNILRCRPPGNRNPTPIEAGNCREYLDGQIEIVNPKYIICWGTIAAQNLLGNNTPIGRMRGQLFSYGPAKVLCTYHPAYMLRNPSSKKQVWEDLKILLQEMGIDPETLPTKQG